jgi:hypothetical protein
MRSTSFALVLLAGVALSACGGDDASSSEAGPRPATATTTAAVPDVSALDRPSCPPDADNCREASGEIAYIERVDPDDDGDAHFILLSSEGVTGPGVSVIDVAASLRPHPLPRRGDLLAAAGPVYPGTYGQHQIQATAIDVVRVPRGG